MRFFAKYARLGLITLAGVVVLCLAAASFYAFRGSLQSIPPVISAAILLFVIGGTYGGFANLVLREVQRLKEVEAIGGR